MIKYYEDFCLKIILYIGLLILPFIIFLDLTPIIPGPITNVYVAKEIFSFLIVSSFIALILSLGRVSKNPCGYLSILLFYLTIAWLVAPSYEIKVLGENVAGIWSFRTVMYAYMAYLMCFGVAGLDWNNNELKHTYSMFTVIGLLCALYLFFQYINWDQWQSIIDNIHILKQTNPRLTSFLGQTNFASSFLALLLPFAICLKRWKSVALMCLAIVITESMMGIGMMAIVLIVYGLFKCGKIVRTVLVSCIVGLIAFALTFYQAIWHCISMNSSGRVQAWTEAFNETIHPSLSPNSTFALTGYGPGSYEFILKNLDTTGFIELHNEFLEFFCTTGSIGLALLILSIIWLFKNIFYTIIIKDEYMFAAACSLFVICLGNLGLFMWQIEPHKFYTIFLLGVIFNRLKRSGKCLKNF